MIAKKVYQKLLLNSLTIAFSESMSGGSLAFEMIKNEGASTVIKGSLIVYSDIMKHKLLGIHLDDIDNYGTVSKEIATQMAIQTSKLFSSDVSVGITGNAGFSFEPKSQERMAYIAIYYQGKMHLETLRFSNITRLKAIKKTRDFTYQKIAQLIV
jgi:nicotinamide-nucleotide amidase